MTTPDLRSSDRPAHGWAWGRWAWRTLTSMRTAVVLLSLLALAAIPGSLLPQRNVASDPAAVAAFESDHPELAPWLDRLGLFEVYASPWFAAVYSLLLVSMTGCVLPRCLRLWRQVRGTPPPAPAHLERLEQAHTLVSRADASALRDRAASVLAERGFRVVTAPGEVSAEKGYLREVGNLVFHLALLVMLFGVAGGKLFGFEGRVALVEGETFTNVVSEYDAFSPAALTDVTGLVPLSLTLDRFEATFAPSGPRVGEPRSFDASVSYSVGNGEDAVAARSATVSPNHPLDVEETKFFLSGHGYAPRVTVRDGRGQVAFSGPVVFLPSDAFFTSDGVVKAATARPAGLGFRGVFLPSAPTGGAALSVFPDLLSPRLDLTAYAGDLGLDAGPQSLFRLDTSRMRQVDRGSLRVGQTLRLPDGAGSITFDGVSRFANFQVAHDPGKEVTLVAAVLLLAGLTVSLLVRRRQVFVRLATRSDGRVEVALAGRSATRRPLPPEEVASLARALDEVLPQPHRVGT